MKNRLFIQKVTCVLFFLSCALFLGIVETSAAVPDDRSQGQKSSQPVTGERVIKGKVLDTNGDPLPGAMIRVIGTKDATVADIDGNYVLETSAKGNSTLNISYIGYKSVTMKANTDNIDITLEVENNQLVDIVVVGYSSMKKASLSSAISNIEAKDLSRTAAVNTSGALAGKVPGINSRQSDGRPGNYVSINIRNMGTPLYVVDGVQMDEGQFNNIDFNDVENISVLKDASAAIYGVRAANGVVVVTTKTGNRNQKFHINVNSYYGWQNLFSFPTTTDATTYVRSSVQASTIAGTTPKYSEEEYQKYVDGTDPQYQTFNWKKFIWRENAPQYYAEINASGGSEKISYYVALSHTKQESLANDFGQYGRTNMQFNVDANITNNFRMKVQVNGRVENNEMAAWNPGLSGTTGYWALAYATVTNAPTRHPYANNNSLYPALISSGGYTNFAISTRDKAGIQNDNWRVLQANISGEWTPIKDLSVKGLFSYFNSNERFKNRYNGYTLYNYDAATNTYPVAKVEGGMYNYRWQYIETLNSQLSIDYKHTWKDAHSLSIFAGIEAYKTNNPGVSYGGTPSMTALKVPYFNELNNFSDWNENTQARLGYMGKINYAYKERYLFEISARYDGSWKFPPHHRWGFFPSVSAGWRISEESFWKNCLLGKNVDNLKLRVSYGVLGDDNVSGYSPFAYLSGYNYNTGTAVLDGEAIAVTSVRNLPVTNISWLKSKTFDIGIDAAFINSRLTGSLDYFQRNRTGLPASRYDMVIPSEVGFGWPAENLNSDMIKGMDASLVWSDKISDLQYSVGGNVTLARNYNWEQYKPTFGNSRDYYVNNGYHRYANQCWGFKAIGQFESWDQIASYPIDMDGRGNSTIRPGDLILEDTNKDYIITDEDQQPIGHTAYPSAGDYGSLDNRTPIINYNMNLSASWKGIDLSADFAGSAKFTHIFNYEARFPFWGESCAFDYMANDQWHLADPYDVNSELVPGKYPTMLYGNNSHSNYYASTFWCKDVWFLKLRNLQIGYTLPSNWSKKFYIERLRVYCFMQNMFSLDNMHEYGVDPESSNTTGTSYPTTKIISFGVNLTF